MRLSPGFQLGRYRIVSHIGTGGMGEVYKARDTRLERDVAIKILSESLADDAEALKRFEREAKAVAALSHPNILDIHDFGSEEGLAYAVMELLDGETLRNCIRRIPLTSTRTLEIGIPIAEGLAAAHSKGVIHRDLKPENIFLTSDGRVKILDFGLARLKPVLSQQELTQAATKSVETEIATIRGTVPYMSPEQVRGTDIDTRSDIFSLGSVLYEMLSGKRAFSGETPADTVSAILKDEPPELTEFVEKIPLELQKVIKYCLEKNREQRFQSAQDIAFALKNILPSSSRSAAIPTEVQVTKTRVSIWKIATIAVAVALVALLWSPLRKRFFHPSAPTKIESLAVLPLKNLSGDSKQDYFADGMTEEIITRLASIKSLRVISRTSVLEYKNQQKSLPEIAKELNVDAIVEGSVLYAGERVRITAQLVHGSTDRHLWAESYEGDLEDVFALQNQVARAVAEEIRITLNPDEIVQLSVAPKVNPEAYEAYLRGISFTRSPDLIQGWRQATEMFERAVALDPQFAKAYAQLSEAHSFMFHFGIDQTEERLQKAKAAVDRALQLQPGLPEAHLALGFYYYWGRKDYNQALKEFTAAQKYLPNNVQALEGIAVVYRRQGNLDASVENFKRIMELNPRDPATPFNIAETYILLRRYAEADTYFDRSIALAPDQKNSYGGKAQNYLLWKGSTPEARAMLEKISGKEDVYDILQWFWLELYDRKYDAALNRVSSASFELIQGPGVMIPKSQLEGLAYRLMGKTKEVQTSFEAARLVLEEKTKQEPNNAAAHSFLAIVYAGLSRKEQAVSEAKLAVQLQPISNNVFASTFVVNLAHVYVMAGEPELAIDRIEYLLSIPCYFVSVPLLRIDPRWDPLRSHPRFQKLLRKS